MQKVKVALIGLGCRGKSLASMMNEMEEAEIVAVSDVYEDRMEEAAALVKKACGRAPRQYADYREALEEKDVDAVVIATSWESHVTIAADSMRAGKVTALEVGGAYTVEDCESLVRVYEETKTPFMFLENCCYGKFELLSTALVRRGMMGEIVHCHGAYAHDLRAEVLGGRVNRHYRLNNYLTRNCENYPTHELGPIARLLNINRGNRMVSLVSVASKAAGLQTFASDPRNPDPTLSGKRFAQGDIVNTLITCEDGTTISLKLDTTLPRFYSREFTVRGTKGCCLQELNAVLLDDDGLEEFFDPNRSVRKYLDSAEKFSEYLPKIWKEAEKGRLTGGHGGMDMLMLREFFRAVLEEKPMPIDVYDAAAWMVITPLSERSIRTGAGVPIPDFTHGAWKTRKGEDVVPLG